MILIDSLYINNSGGLRLLQYLIKELYKRGVQFQLLADRRTEGIFEFVNVEYLPATLMSRRHYYIEHQNDFDIILCFGNIPPSIKLNASVYTYFHNINLLTLKEVCSIKNWVLAWIKRQVFRHLKHNTDYWIVQTDNTARELVAHLHERDDRVKLMPFYELSPALISLKGRHHGGDYIFVSNYTGAKGHEELLEAWCLLHKRGYNMTLHLTVPYDEDSFIDKIKNAQALGVRVVNHGFIPFEQIVGLYRESKAIIYPSHNESLGLGIVEAVSAGCDVIGADLPYIRSICKPSEVFDPYVPESIANAVISYEKGVSGKSELLIHNHIDELIGLLKNN